MNTFVRARGSRNRAGEFDTNDPGCHSDRKDFYKGALVHIPGQCRDGWRSELLSKTGHDDPVWRAVTDTGILHGVGINTGHVICGTSGEEWVLEKYDAKAWFEDVPAELARRLDEIRQGWVRIMNPRDLETAMRWAKQKTEEGLLVRIRNVETDDILVGAIFGPMGHKTTSDRWTKKLFVP